jgi:protein-tyrosine phosphatase
MKPAWGRIYQSGVIASEDWDQDGLIVSLSGNENFRGPVLWVDMPDNDIDTLPSPLLISFVETVISFLRQGIDVLIHCNEGKYRSTYLDMAVHIKCGMSFEEAYELIRMRHPIAALRIGTEEQLRQLKGESK